MYVLVEDTGVNTGFDMAANVDAPGVIPMIAKGPNMAFEPCQCDVQPGLQKGVNPDLEEQNAVKEIIKQAEKTRLNPIINGK